MGKLHVFERDIKKFRLHSNLHCYITRKSLRLVNSHYNRTFSSMPSSGVPMFKLRPQRGTLWLSVVMLILGGLAFWNGHRDPGDIPAHDRSNLFLAFSIVVSGVLIIISTSRMWFQHLWHDRYAGSKKSRKSHRHSSHRSSHHSSRRRK